MNPITYPNSPRRQDQVARNTSNQGPVYMDAVLGQPEESHLDLRQSITDCGVSPVVATPGPSVLSWSYEGPTFLAGL